MNEKPSRFRIFRRTTLILVAAGIVVLVVLRNCESAPQLPVYGTIPNFSLIAVDGRVVTLDNFAGRVFIADFIFTRCAGTCPVMSRQMQTLQTEFTSAPDIHLVSITVDPDYDTKEVLQHYAQQYGAVPEKWTMLTGEKSAIHQLSQQGLRLGVSEEGGTPTEPIIHSTKFVLVDRKGRIRGYYDGTEEEDVRRLIDDVRRLMKEAT